jgi:signal transduction histidine kinase
MRENRFGYAGFAVLALAVLLNVVALYTAERGFRELRETAAWVRHTLVAENRVERLYRLAVDAETGQRGYLLTSDSAFLEPYLRSRGQIKERLNELRDLTADNPAQTSRLAKVDALLATRFEQMEQTIALKRDQAEETIRDTLLSRRGNAVMDSLRLVLDEMLAEERAQQDLRLHAFVQDQETVRFVFFVEVAINVVLVVLGVAFLAREAGRRRREIHEAQQNTARLAAAVQGRTEELTELSHYLQRLQEDEKSTIARDIHDDLGGRLAAAKIDLQLLADKIGTDHAQQPRIARIMAGIDDAVLMKRRIIERLRPTVLDSLGIGPALKWQCTQYSNRWGTACRAELHDENLRLSTDYSTTFYRVAQEALTNISKYANAKNIVLSLLKDKGDWVLRVVDDGVGIDPGARHNATPHGVVSMRERARAVGGIFSIEGTPGRGTVVEVRVPIEA